VPPPRALAGTQNFPVQLSSDSLKKQNAYAHIWAAAQNHTTCIGDLNQRMYDRQAAGAKKNSHQHKYKLKTEGITQDT
jgi:hypothetical protein